MTALRAAWGLRRDAAAALLLAQVAVAGTALVVNVAAARVLAPTGRGELALLLQIGYLSSLVLMLGLDRSLVAVYSGERVGAVTSALLRLLRGPAGLGLAFAVASVLAPVPWSDTWARWVGIAVLFAVVNAYVRGSRSVAIASGREPDFVRYTLLSQGLLLAGVAALTVGGVVDTGAWLAVYLASAAVPTAVQLLRWRREPGLPSVPEGVCGPAPAEQLATARREGLQLLPSALATSGMLRVDRLLLPALASTAALGLYAGVATMTELLAWPLGALADARLGRWRQAHDAGRLAVRRLLLGSAAYAVLGALLLARVVQDLAIPLLGPSYAAARDLVPPLVVAAAVFAVEQVAVVLLIARRRNRTASLVETAGFAAGLLAYLWLIPLHGALGAAYGSVVGYGTSLLLACVALGRRGPGAGTVVRHGRGDAGSASRALPGADRDGARAGVAAGGDGGPPGEEAPAAAVLRTIQRAGVGWAPLLALLLVAIGGRYTLERSGITWLAWLDLRILGLVVAIPLVAAAVRRARRVARPAPLPEGWIVAAVLFFAVQIGSGLWAPPGARVVETAVDVAATAALFLAFYALARSDPEGVLRRTLWFLLWTGLVFAAGAFASGGGGVQGRFAAFGGGPNVFVRIELLAVLAAVTLVLIGADRRILLALPPLLVAAVASGSRGGLLAALITLAVLCVRAGRRARRLALAGLAGTVPLLVLAGALWAPVADLLQTRFLEQTVEEQYASDRTSIWEETLDLALQNPVAGVGLDGFHGDVGIERGIEYPHNYVFAVAAEGGAVALGLLAVSVVLWARTLRSAPAGRGPMAVLTTAMATAALFVGVATLFSGHYYDARLAWCFAALAAAGAAARRAAPAPDALPARAGGGTGGQPPRRPSTRVPHRPLSGAVRG